MLATAVTTATTAVGNIIPDTPTQGQIDAAESAIAAVEALDSDHGMLAGWKRTVARAKDELQRDMAAEQQGDKDGEADTAAMTAKLNKLLAAIGTANVAANFATTADPDDGSANYFIQGTPGTKDPKAVDGDAPQAISGWNGMSYSVKNGMETTETVVYDNKGPQVSRPFFIVGSNGGQYTRETEGHYNIPDSADASIRKLIELSGLPAHASHTNGPEIGNVNVPGKFNGVDGNFVAATGTITVLVDADGVPRWASGGVLEFTPGSATATVMVDDPSYMSLGWWLTTHDVNGINDVRVAAWKSGADYDGDSKFASLNGKATFQGIAVGKYTYRQATTIEGGHFNADTELEANFDSNLMTGTIDNFMQDGQSIGNGWKVELADGQTTFNATDGATIGADGTDGTEGHQANGALGTFGNFKVPGAWRARFVGNERNDPMPSGVVGEFHIGATGQPINMVGAFAAENQVPDQSAP